MAFTIGTSGRLPEARMAELMADEEAPGDSTPTLPATSPPYPSGGLAA